MPVPRHDRLTFSGCFGPPSNPAEIWSFNLTFEYVEALGGTTTEAAAAARQFYANLLAPVIPTYAVLTRTRYARVAAGGQVVRLGDGSFDQGDDETVVGGTSAGLAMPLQTALVASFSSARPDATGKGRAFLPGLPAALDESFRIPEGRALATATAVRNFCQQFARLEGPNTEIVGPNPGPHVVVSGRGYTSRVTTYRVGRVPDTMRSRRNQMAEAYAEVPA